MANTPFVDMLQTSDSVVPEKIMPGRLKNFSVFISRAENGWVIHISREFAGYHHESKTYIADGSYASLSNIITQELYKDFKVQYQEKQVV